MLPLVVVGEWRHRYLRRELKRNSEIFRFLDDGYGYGRVCPGVAT